VTSDHQNSTQFTIWKQNSDLRLAGFSTGNADDPKDQYDRLTQGSLMIVLGLLVSLWIPILCQASNLDIIVNLFNSFQIIFHTCDDRDSNSDIPQLIYRTIEGSHVQLARKLRDMPINIGKQSTEKQVIRNMISSPSNFLRRKSLRRFSILNAA